LQRLILQSVKNKELKDILCIKKLFPDDLADEKFIGIVLVPNCIASQNLQAFVFYNNCVQKNRTVTHPTNQPQKQLNLIG